LPWEAAFSNREIGEDPSLWTLGRVTVHRGNLEKLDTRRLQHMPRMIVMEGDWESLELEKLFKAVVRLNKLCYLYMPNINISSVEPGLLATAVNKLKWLDITQCQLTSQQVNTMVGRMSVATKLRTLLIDCTDLSTVDKDTLGIAVNMLNCLLMFK
jgi:hypothetical protein